MKALVTGAAGFLGGVLTRQLLEAGHEVAVLVRREVPELAALGVEVRQADLRNRARVVEGCRGVDCVFHVAAKAGIWGSYQEYFAANVQATRNVLEGCRQGGVPRLVYTSSPSVTFGGSSTPGVDETYPYPKRFLNAYSRTKALAEQIVLEADRRNQVMACALRPHIIWGPGDVHIVPRLISRARAGRLVRVGDGTNLVDITYVDNAAQAHLLAAERLSEDAGVRGRVFFISQGEPVNLWGWVDGLLSRLDIPPVRRSLPLWAAQLLGAALEGAWWVFRLPGEPLMTRFMAAQLGTSHYFDIAAARERLGYQPAVSTAEGMDRLIAWLDGRRP